MAPPTSWVPGSTNPNTDFTLQNIPFGIISTEAIPRPHAAVAIGDYAFDLQVFSADPFFDSYFPLLQAHPDVFSQPTLNAFAALGRQVHRDVRWTLQQLLEDGSPASKRIREDPAFLEKVMVPLAKVTMHLPMQIGDYTDFYAGVVHARHVGTMFRGPGNALQPNYTHLPVGYHGRASSIVVSGTPVRRPWGQFVADAKNAPNQPQTRPSQKLDFELELGCFISCPNDMGTPIDVNDAEEHIFGYVLLNDWSARDVQAWEYVPLGPFNGKNFATTISPWVVLADALEPFRTSGEPNDTGLQPYLQEREKSNALDISLGADLRTPSGTEHKLTRTNARHLLWSFPQMIAHHTVGGCPLRTGDLLGSGTISSLSEDGDGGGSLLELSENGTKALRLQGAGGVEERRFLQDGDTVVLRGSAFDREKGRVGFGECAGRIEPAIVPATR